MLMKTMEVLSPAGDLKTAKIAYVSGADAVYFGGQMYGARASAKNFSTEDIAALLEYAHIRGKKAYITVNTLLKNTEIQKSLYDFMLPVYEAGVDGVIIQDFGVLSFLHRYFPGLPLHASTQMNLTSAYGAAFLKECHADRIVTAREISIEEIKHIKSQVNIEIETFVHGALCMCYSGQCLMSSFIGGRSGNRGRCAQPCRQPYEICDGHKKSLSKEQRYYLSPKDLCGIRDLTRLRDAGVDSLKIEGRLKNEAYVSTVTSVYRHYVDLLSEDVPYAVEEKDLSLLRDAGHRGLFTREYYDMHNSADMMTLSDGSFHQNRDAIAPVEQKEKKKPLFGEWIAKQNAPVIFTVWDEDGHIHTINGEVPQPARTKGTTKEEIEEKLSALGDMPYVFEELSIQIEEGLFLPMKQVKQIRRDALSALFDVPKINREAHPYTPCPKPRGLANTDTDAFCISVENEAQLSAVKSFDFVTDLILKDGFFYRTNLKEAIASLKKRARAYVSLPVILRQSTADAIREAVLSVSDEVDGFYVSSYDGLGFLQSLGIQEEKVYFDPRLYAYSDCAVSAFSDYGYHHMALPLELNEKELAHRFNETSEACIYGYVPLMYMANCIKKNTVGCQKGDPYLRYLKDKKQAVFPVVTRCRDCVNILYNCLPLCLFDGKASLLSMGIRRFRLDFTIESEKETKEVLRRFVTVWEEGAPLSSGEFTRGHFRRGVE